MVMLHMKKGMYLLRFVAVLVTLACAATAHAAHQVRAQRTLTLRDLPASDLAQHRAPLGEPHRVSFDLPVQAQCKTPKLHALSPPQGPVSPPPASVFPMLTHDSGPPDIQAAVGTSAILLATNMVIRVFNRAGDLLHSVSPRQFFDHPDSWLFDPGLDRDAATGRWVLTMATGASSVVVAVSATPDPLGAWKVREIALDEPGTWLDQPRMALQGPGLLVCGDRYTTLGYPIEGICVAVARPLLLGDKSWPLLPEAALVDRRLWPVADPDAQLTDLRAVAVRGPMSKASMILQVFDPSTLLPQEPVAIDVPVGGLPGYVTQLAGPSLTAGKPLTRPVFRLGSLWLAWVDGVDDSTDHVASQVRFAQTTIGGAVLQTGVAHSAGDTVSFASLAVSTSGAVLIGYTRFGEASHPSAAYAVRLSGDPTGSVRAEQVAREGRAAFGSYDDDWGDLGRWGDYSASVADPVYPDQLWTFQEYAEVPVASNRRFGVAAVAVRLPCGASAAACDMCEICSGGKCLPAADGSPCADTSRCSRNDQCTAGVCMGVPHLCESSGVCGGSQTCQPDDGACLATAGTSTAACDDGDPCTLGDRCDGGWCHGQLRVCPSDPCHLGWCSATNGQCYQVLREVAGCVSAPPAPGCSATRATRPGSSAVWWLAAAVLLLRACRKRRALALMIGLMLAACTDVELTPAPITTPIQFYVQFAKLQCQRLVKCPSSYRVVADLANCEAGLLQAWSVLTPDHAYSIQGAGVSFDAGAATACLAHLRGLGEPCRQWLPQTYALGWLGPPCANVFRGTLPAGVACPWSEWCASGHCQAATETGLDCGSYRCAASAAIGQACKYANDCQALAVCSDGTCQAEVWNLPSGAACGNGRNCAADLSCQGPELDRRCGPYKGEGEACALGSESGCGNWLTCEAEGTGGRCRYPKTGEDCYQYSDAVACLRDDMDCFGEKCRQRPRLGELCSEDGQCMGLDTLCSTTQGSSGQSGQQRRCVLRPGLGEACSAKAHFGCRPGLRCTGAHCVALGDVGQTCQNDAECLPLLWCLTGRCRMPRQAGETCNTDEQCVLGLKCFAGKCGAPHVRGGPCKVRAECASGLTCRGGLCELLGGEGAACQGGEDCGVGLGCDGIACWPGCSP